MSFISFAASYGVLIEHTVQGKWIKVPTVDHPRKKNGSYKFEGGVGWVQNYASMERPAMWRDKEYAPPDPAVLRKTLAKAEEERRAKQVAAAKKAAWIMHNAKKATHPYLIEKGFPEEKGWVWNNLLVIPMRVDGALVGCQLIDEKGTKKFLSGQQTKGATAAFDTKGRVILCEGYATALSVRRALKLGKLRYNIQVCFSAGNMEQIALCQPDCFIVADNDKSGTGQRVAKKTGRPYWLAPMVGMDANDFELQFGTLALCDSLKERLAA